MKSRALVFTAISMAAFGCGDGREEPADDFGAATAVDSPAVAPATGATGAAGPASSARATLRGPQGEEVGTAVFSTEGTGVRIAVMAEGLEPGEKGIHIHAVGRCDPPDFSSAGPHFAPQGRQHGFENPAGPHAGDLRNLEVGSDGTARQEFTTNEITLGDGPNSIFDEDGTAIVIHAGPDDYRTDPSGNSGDRIACGVVERG